MLGEDFNSCEARCRQAVILGLVQSSELGYTKKEDSKDALGGKLALPSCDSDI